MAKKTGAVSTKRVMHIRNANVLLAKGGVQVLGNSPGGPQKRDREKIREKGKEDQIKTTLGDPMSMVRGQLS